MNSAVLLILSLLACGAFSQSVVGGRSRCLCMQTRNNLGVPARSIKNMEIFPVSTACDNMEIIINLRNGNQICLNPNSPKIRDILAKMRSKRAASGTK